MLNKSIKFILMLYLLVSLNSHISQLILFHFLYGLLHFLQIMKDLSFLFLVFIILFLLHNIYFTRNLVAISLLNSISEGQSSCLCCLIWVAFNVLFFTKYKCCWKFPSLSLFFLKQHTRSHIQMDVEVSKHFATLQLKLICFCFSIL